MNEVFLMLGCILNSAFWFFIMNIGIKRIERALRQFYLPLRDGHPNEYIKQSKVIKFIRRHTKLSDYDDIHWAYSMLHCLQIILLFGTPIVAVSAFFVTAKTSFSVYIAFFIVVMITFSLLADIFACFQAIRCSKIKKTNPKYAKCEVLHWKN